MLQVRWTAAGFWYEHQSLSDPSKLTYTNTGHAGFDIVWQAKVFKQPDGTWLQYPWDYDLLSASAAVAQQGNLPGSSCSAQGFTIPRSSGAFNVGSSVTNLAFANPVAARWDPPQGVPASSACGNFNHFYSGQVCWDNFKACAKRTFTPVLPVPPYTRNDNDPTWRGGGARLIADPRDPQSTRSYIWNMQGEHTWTGTDSFHITESHGVHSLWFGCASVQLDPPNPGLPAPIDPLTLGGYNPLGALDNPRPPPSSACSGVKGVSPSSDSKILAKLQAQEDLRRALAAAAWPCLVTAAGIGGTLFSAGAFALPLRFASGIVGGAGVLTCGPLMQQIELDTAIVNAKDPPLRRAGPLALPACGRLTGATLALCNALRTAATKAVIATQAAASATHALDVALVAYGTALRRHDEASAAKNAPALVQATSRAKSASDAADAARASFYQLIGQAGFGVRLTRAQSAKAISVMLAKLRAHGVSESALRKYAGDALTPHATVIVAAVAPKPAIESVTFGGSPAHPSIVVHGTNLGTQPKPDPPVHPLGTSGCPVTVPGGDDGYDYGTSLYLAVPAKNWAGGRYRPSLNETDCIDLVVTKFTSTEVDFRFGRSYASFYPKFSLNDGDAVEVGVNGATKAVHVKYGATVSS